MNIKILGGGCKNCITLYENAQEAAKELGIDAEIEKVTEMKDILSFGVMKTPGLVVDGIVKVSGRVPSKDEVKKILSE
ncbi:thioredoxin family protein [Crassaminicella thermophila]|uniref:Thioredoxin family protein n=1 Tax=Crassaminicella thermophila TaxID=2599308 RepID=A0A5C0SAC4_CRATE|nr:thioredoxin family protein [Crassaminicella thermophila]QEK10937.1 thioredoxin family protein [Crassaminicella thermophila]